MPLPSPEATPPVTKMNFGCSLTTGPDSSRGLRRSESARGRNSPAIARRRHLRRGVRLQLGGLRAAAPRRARRRSSCRRARRACGRAPRTRRSSSSTSTAAVPSSLRTRTCRSAKQAICGRWVTTSTWRSRASARQARPTASPASPADAGVDLVEDEGRHVVEVGQHAAAREHRARELAARGRASPAASARSRVRPRTGARPARPRPGPARRAARARPRRRRPACRGRGAPPRSPSASGPAAARAACGDHARPARSTSAAEPRRPVRELGEALVGALELREPRRRSPA